MSAEAGERDEWTDSHRGALWGIGHPGPAAGCPYCTDTLSQAGYTTLADAYFAPRPATPDAGDASRGGAR